MWLRGLLFPFLRNAALMRGLGMGVLHSSSYFSVEILETPTCADGIPLQAYITNKETSCHL